MGFGVLIRFEGIGRAKNSFQISGLSTCVDGDKYLWEWETLEKGQVWRSNDESEMKTSNGQVDI